MLNYAIYKKEEDKFHIIDSDFEGLWEINRDGLEMFLWVQEEIIKYQEFKIDKFRLTEKMLESYPKEEWNSIIDFIKERNLSSYSQFDPGAIRRNLNNTERGIVTPPMVIYEVNRICNYNCPWCYLENMDQKLEKNLEEIKDRIIDPLIKMGTNFWGITGGEPSVTLDKTIKLISMIKNETMKAFGYAPSVLLFTNGHRLKENAAKYKEAGVTQIQVSLSSPVEEKEISLRRAPSGINSYKEAVEGIKEAKKLGLHIILNTVLTSDTGGGSNIEDIPKVYELSRELEIDTLDINLACPSGQAKKNNIIFSHEEYLKIDKTMKASRFQADNKFEEDLPLDDLEKNRNITCGVGLSKLYIDYRGYVYPCNNMIDEKLKCSDDTVFEQDIRDIWVNSEMLKPFRNYLERNINDECGDCEYRGFCIGSCFAKAWHQYGVLRLDQKPEKCYKDHFEKCV